MQSTPTFHGQTLLSAQLSARFEEEFRATQSQSRKKRRVNTNHDYDRYDSSTQDGDRDLGYSETEQNHSDDRTAGMRGRKSNDFLNVRKSPCSHTTMPSKPPFWISLWFAITIPVIFWDASYCFLRPRSMVGGDLHWIWKPYELYQNIDYVYGLPALEKGDGFTNAQSLLNVIENFMNMGYLYLVHVSGSPLATMLGFASVVMTLSKTFLYWAQEYYCGGCAIGHNDFKTLFIYWIIPNGLWLVVPSFIVYRLGKDISNSLNLSARLATKETSGKKQ
ncbi:hypothetical protein ABKN59_011025 [Abortiporus biennis]